MSLLRAGLLLVVIIAVALTCCGCGTGSGQVALGTEAVASDSGWDGQGLYKLREGDKLEISFLTDETLHYSTPISPAGTISLPSGDEIRAAGLTSGQVRASIEDKMSTYLLDSTASVTIIDIASQPVYVLGEVRSPGQVSMMNGNISVSMAITEAGGLLSTGKPSSVVVIRSGSTAATAIRVDVSKVLSARDLSQDIRLEPYDIVFVPKSFIGKVDEFVDLFFDNIAPAQLFYLRGYDIAQRRPLGFYQ
ncbi:MAG: polysaccharide export protein [Candidatus Eisenbacteria bacterium]|nr:polysaccharide export protein [Candidatus Eisenbacteria bacterium]